MYSIYNMYDNINKFLCNNLFISWLALCIYIEESNNKSMYIIFYYNYS